MNPNKAGLAPVHINNLSYVGQKLSLLPVISLDHAPTVNDRNYPVMTFAYLADENDTDFGSIWYLKEFDGVTGDKPNAIWVRLSSGTGGPVLDVAVPSGTSPVTADSDGLLTYTSTAGTIDVTGSTNAIDFDIADGAVVASIPVPAGTNPVVPDSSNQITFNADTGVTITGGTNELTIGLTGGGIAADSFAVPSGTSPVVPDANGLVTITAGTGVTVTGGTNTYEIGLTGEGQAVDSFGIDSTSGTGVDPVIPDANGNINISASQVAPGTIGANVIDTHSSAVNAYNIRIQQTDTSASKDTTKNGVAHFDSDYFSNDEGFISFASGFYATGTWTPVLSFGGGSTGITYSTQEGQYTRIGNVVYFHYRCVLTSKGTDTGVAVISGLPYTVGSTLNAYGNNGSMSAGSLPGTATQFHNAIQPGTTTIDLRGTTPATNTQMDNTHFANNTTFGCTGFYWV